jgi:hypothetical protein
MHDIRKALTHSHRMANVIKPTLSLLCEMSRGRRDLSDPSNLIAPNIRYSR